MFKIEIIHNKETLLILKDLMALDKLYGFTCMNVHEGYGPMKGEYKEDHFSDEQYFSIILLEDEHKADHLIEAIRNKSASKFICLKSKVTYIKA